MSSSVINHLYVLPEGTCCFRAALHLAKSNAKPPPEFIIAASFYEGMSKVKDASGGPEGSYLLVPDISEANAVITEAPGWNWSPELSFALPNPPLHYAKSKGATVPNHQSRCASIPALRPLLLNDPRFQKPEKFEFHDVHSTQEAAIAATEGEAGFCITNEEGLKKAKRELSSILVLKPMTVFWKLFYYTQQ